MTKRNIKSTKKKSHIHRKVRINSSDLKIWIENIDHDPKHFFWSVMWDFMRQGKRESEIFYMTWWQKYDHQEGKKESPRYFIWDNDKNMIIKRKRERVKDILVFHFYYLLLISLTF